MNGDVRMHNRCWVMVEQYNVEQLGETMAEWQCLESPELMLVGIEPQKAQPGWHGLDDEWR